MEASYRKKLGNLQFTNEEIGVVVNSTMKLLRRHCVDETLCPWCGSDAPEAFQVTQVDELGFITEVECEACQTPQKRLSAICHDSHRRYESIEDPSILRPGDHISWHRPYLIWHHAMVMEQDLAGKAITVYEYTLSGVGPYAAIIETRLSYDKFVNCSITALCQ